MPIDALALPPEINSARLISGAGLAPMQAAATAYTTLGTGFGIAAGRLTALMAQIALTYHGESAAIMQASFAPYIAWMQSTCAQLGVAAGRAQAQAGAYITAVASMPTLPELAALQTEHAVLVATNPLVGGLNTPAILANEAAYAAEWARAAAVQSAYFAATAVNSTLEAFVPSPPLTTPSTGMAEASIAGTAAAATATPAKELAMAQLNARAAAQNVQMAINQATSVSVEQGGRARNKRNQRAEEAQTQARLQAAQTAAQVLGQALSSAASAPSQAASLVTGRVQELLSENGLRPPQGFHGTQPGSPTLQRLDQPGGGLGGPGGGGISTVGMIPAAVLGATGAGGVVNGLRLPTAWSTNVAGAVPLAAALPAGMAASGMVPPPIGQQQRQREVMPTVPSVEDTTGEDAVVEDAAAFENVSLPDWARPATDEVRT